MEDNKIEIRSFTPSERKDVLYVEVTPDLAQKVLKAAKDTGMSKSQIARLCVEFALPSVVETLLKMKSGKLK